MTSRNVSGADAAREAARQTDGKFGVQERPEAGAVVLAAAPGPARPDDTVAALTPLVAEMAERVNQETQTSDTAQCGCMSEDPGDGYGERVVTHSRLCSLHPEHGQIDPLTRESLVSLGERLLTASETDRPGYEDLSESLESLIDEDGEADHDLPDSDYQAVLAEMRQFTAADNMRVVEDGHGGHLRVRDGRPGHTCPDCGAGFATGEVLILHREQDCDGTLDAEDSAADDEAYETLHAAAESYASDVNNGGPARQRDFLKRLGWTDEQVAEHGYGPAMTEDDHLRLGDAVIDAASQAASDHYNAGDSDAAPLLAALDGADEPVDPDDAVFLAEHESGAHDGEAFKYASMCPACEAQAERAVESAAAYLDPEK